MKICYPDYYYDFACLAGKCKHSCCRGWEIDIDDDSLKRFGGIKGELGIELQKAISTEGMPHFILKEDESCPFLLNNGLCKLIIELGEDSICDICTEHPRFYNELEGETDVGLGACCEVAARLIVNGKASTGYLVYGEKESSESELIALRKKIFDILSEEDSLSRRMKKCLSLVNGDMPNFDLSEEAKFYLTLERMDNEWTSVLEKLAERNEFALEPRLSEMRFQRIAEYFVYRHFASTADMKQAALRLQFAFLSTLIICAAGDDTENILRLYSGEIEYSDENISLILERLNGNVNCR